MNRLYDRKATVSAEAGQLCLFMDQKESNLAVWFYRSSPLSYSSSQRKGNFYLCMVFCENTRQQEVRRKDEILSVCKHFYLCVSAYVHKIWAVTYVEILERTKSLVYIFCQFAYGERDLFFAVILTLKMKFQTPNHLLYWIVFLYRTFRADDHSIVFVNCGLFCT